MATGGNKVLGQADRKRLFVGNLNADVTREDLKKLIGKFGDVTSVDIKTKNDVEGNPLTTFAFVEVGGLGENGAAELIKAYNGVKWKKKVGSPN